MEITDDVLEKYNARVVCVYTGESRLARRHFSDRRHDTDGIYIPRYTLGWSDMTWDSNSTAECKATFYFFSGNIVLNVVVSCEKLKVIEVCH
jgi:hypothetical protein